MPKFLYKDEIAQLSMKQLENRVFVFESSAADEKYFRTAIARRVQGRENDEFREFRDFLWDIIFERNNGGETIKYLHFNDRTQKVYLDWYFVEWASRASDEIPVDFRKNRKAINYDEKKKVQFLQFFR